LVKSKGNYTLSGTYVVLVSVVRQKLLKIGFGGFYSHSFCELFSPEASRSPPEQVVPSDVAVDVHVTGKKVEPTVRLERNHTKPVSEQCDTSKNSFLNSLRL